MTCNDLSCDWKMVPENEYSPDVKAVKCGALAAVRLHRKGRNSDLFLCVDHWYRHVAIYGFQYLPCEPLVNGSLVSDRL